MIMPSLLVLLSLRVKRAASATSPQEAGKSLKFWPTMSAHTQCKHDLLTPYTSTQYSDVRSNMNSRLTGWFDVFQFFPKYRGRINTTAFVQVPCWFQFIIEVQKWPLFIMGMYDNLPRVRSICSCFCKLKIKYTILVKVVYGLNKRDMS